MKHFKNFIPHKTQNLGYTIPNWINRSITLSSKKSKLPGHIIQIQQMLLHQVGKCTKLFTEAKDKHLAKLSSQLHKILIQHQSNWHIINHFLNNQKIRNIPPVVF